MAEGSLATENDVASVDTVLTSSTRSHWFCTHTASSTNSLLTYHDSSASSTGKCNA